MARVEPRSAPSGIPAHLAGLWDDPEVVVHRPARRKPFKPALRVTVPVSARELIGRDPEPPRPSDGVRTSCVVGAIRVLSADAKGEQPAHREQDAD
jgi:hypothetical protein